MLAWAWSRRRGYSVSRVPPTVFLSARPQDVLWLQNLDEKAPIAADLREGCSFNKWRAAGAVVAGDWDQQVLPVESFPVYRPFRQHFIDKVDWLQIEGLEIEKKRAERKAKRNFRMTSCEGAHQERFAALDKMFSDFQANEYYPQSKITGRIFDELAVNVGRHGQLIRNSSAGHRLVVAQLSGLHTIPARVVVRHSEWEALRNKVVAHVLESGSSSLPKELESYRNHPDVVAAINSKAHVR